MAGGTQRLDCETGFGQRNAALVVGANGRAGGARAPVAHDRAAGLRAVAQLIIKAAVSGRRQDYHRSVITADDTEMVYLIQSDIRSRSQFCARVRPVRNRTLARQRQLFRVK